MYSYISQTQTNERLKWKKKCAWQIYLYVGLGRNQVLQCFSTFTFTFCVLILIHENFTIRLRLCVSVRKLYRNKLISRMKWIDHHISLFKRYVLTFFRYGNESFWWFTFDSILHMPCMRNVNFLAISGDGDGKKTESVTPTIQSDRLCTDILEQNFSPFFLFVFCSFFFSIV